MERAQIIVDNHTVFSAAEVAAAKKVLESDRTSMLPSENIVPTEAQVEAMIQAGQFVEAANGYRLMGRLDEADKIQFLLSIRELHVIADAAKQSGRADDYLKVVEKAKLILAQQVPDAQYKQRIEKALAEWERVFEEESKTAQFSFAGLSEVLTEILTEDDISTQILRDINVAQVAPQPAPPPPPPPAPAPKPAEEIQPSSETQVGDPIAMLIAKLGAGELKESLIKAGNDKKTVRRILESAEDAEIDGAENEFDAAYEIVSGA